VLATHSIRLFPLHFSSRASPCAIRFRFSSTNHSIALSRCGGQNWKWGRRHQSAGMRRWSVRSICAIISLFHNQMAVPSLHSVSRCTRMSRLPVSATIRLHEPDGVQALISRYYIMYHMDAISSDTQAVCRFFSNLYQLCVPL